MPSHPPQLISLADVETILEAATKHRTSVAEAIGVERTDAIHDTLGRISVYRLGDAVLLIHRQPSAAEQDEDRRLATEAERRRQHQAELRRQEQAEAQERQATTH